MITRMTTTVTPMIAHNITIIGTIVTQIASFPSTVMFESEAVSTSVAHGTDNSMLEDKYGYNSPGVVMVELELECVTDPAVVAATIVTGNIASVVEFTKKWIYKCSVWYRSW